MNEDFFINSRKRENIRRISLSNKNKYYYDLINIDNSWTGRADVWNIANTFILESEQLLINSIELFELGFFDCAYYQLRTAIELSTTIVFLSDMPENERLAYTESWKETKHFPMQKDMIKLLSANGNIFSDMKEKMPHFFSKTKQLSFKINKNVHKQGLDHFYVCRNHPINNNKSQKAFIDNFEYFLKKCIGIVSVMRLAIDPFPVLLMDEEILYRCFDSLTEPYSLDFIEEYIGEDTINEYKKTKIYVDTYNLFIKNERKNEAVFNIVRFQYIDSTKKEEILNQLHLMDIHEILCALIALFCDKSTKIYCFGGFNIYTTERKSKRNALSWSSKDFDDFEKSEQKINQPYDEAYISVIYFNNEAYFIEHNEELNEIECKQLVSDIENNLHNIESKV